MPLPLGLTDCFRAAWLPVHPFPLGPPLASKAGPADLPAPPAPGPQLLPQGLEWKGHRSVICSREFSGDRRGPAFSGCYAGIHPAFRTGKACTGLEPQMDSEQRAS